jgi:hypothetical protein
MSASLRRSPLPPCSCPSLVIGEPLASRPLRRRARITRLDRDPLDLIERYVLLVTFLLVIFCDLTEGILAGFGLGALLFLHRMAQSHKCTRRTALPESALPLIADESLHRGETTRCAKCGHAASARGRRSVYASLDRFARDPHEPFQVIVRL